MTWSIAKVNTETPAIINNGIALIDVDGFSALDNSSSNLKGSFDE
jgi:hypothetical protein